MASLTPSGTNGYTGPPILNGGRLGLDFGTNDTSQLANASALTPTSGTLELAGRTHPEIVSNTTLSNNSATTITRSGGEREVTQRGGDREGQTS